MGMEQPGPSPPAGASMGKPPSPALRHRHRTHRQRSPDEDVNAPGGGGPFPPVQFNAHRAQSAGLPPLGVSAPARAAQQRSAARHGTARLTRLHPRRSQLATTA